jgi:predicted HD phosphohydrolase
MYETSFDRLLPLLQRLESVAQEPRFHPEGNALFHSLQVWQLADAATTDPVLLAAALLHDVGKAIAGGDHAESGATLLEGIACAEVVWLVEHHLDLLRDEPATRKRFRGDPRLDRLARLRAWDLGGRRPHARVPDVERALGALFEPGVAEGWLDIEVVATAVKEHAY